jgi:hypothetical protein
MTGVRPDIFAPIALACGLASCGFGGDLQVSAPRTTLGVGESVRLAVKAKGAAAPPSLSGIRYWTASESSLVVEPDGRVTCVGTHGLPSESTRITAALGPSHGVLDFSLLPTGPGPKLELAADSGVPLPENARSRAVPCCAEVLVLREGQTVRYAIRERSTGRDLTAAATGTVCTLFFGSGVPNDPSPSIITGGPDTLAKEFRLDDRVREITAPPSIGRLNRGRIVVFFRNGDLAGWREVVVIHR